MLTVTMAEIANSMVFTNGVTCNTTDLLQRAFQEVIDDDDNEFVTFLTDGTEGDVPHTIHLTQTQAAELNLNFEVDSCADDQTEELSYHSQHHQQQQQCETSTLNGYDNTHNRSKFESDSPNTPKGTSDTIDYETTRWSIDNKLDGHDADTPNKTITIDEITSSAKTIFINSDSSKKDEDFNNISSNLNEIQLAIDDKNINHNFPTTALSSSPSQILQKLPVFLPSSQFIIKPAQTILKTSKSIQLITNNKIKNINENDSVNNSGNQHQNHNSVLLPKVSTLLNSVNSHVFKGTSVASQVVNNNNNNNSLSAQLLTPQVITSESSNTNINNKKNFNLIANGVKSHNMSNTQQIRLLPRVNGAIQEANPGQFTGIINKTPTVNESVNGKLSADNLIGGKISTEIIPSRTGQFTPRMITASVGKLGTTATKVPINSSKSSSITFPAGTVIKPNNFRSVNTVSSGFIQRNGTSTSTPVSILKPQPKVFPNSKQSFTVDSKIQTVCNGIGNLQNLQKIVKVPPQSLPMDAVNRLQNNNLTKLSESVVNKPDVKKSKILGMLSSGTAGQTDLAKPLGSNENPIQIVQQGHTFHSSQKLTQSQLKQIANVLQQRSQESSISNEKIVYRVVFPEELDLRIRNPMNLLKSRGGKRGRPKKKPTKSMIVEDDSEETKDERKKHVARTRSGRLSRPPKHIVRDYKHLHHLDFMEPDMDDSDGGYSDYYVNNEKIDSEETAKDLLTGYEGPKRKISDHFRCPTCCKIYLGRSRMTKHFELHPDHGSPDQLPPMSAEPELKQSPQYPQDQFKRKGKRRGPWAYITPEAKSERRQIKLKEALVACDTEEILKIAAKPVLNAQSFFDLMVIKSDNCLKTFLSELKTLVDTARERVSTMLSPENNDQDKDKHVLELNDDLLCDTLGLVPGYYNVNDEIFKSSNQFYNTSFTTSTDEEPPSKLTKIDNDDGKENINERLNHIGDNNVNVNVNVNISNFINDRKFESVNANCPEVLTALTLMPRNSSPINATESLSKSHSNVSTKLLISNPEIQSQILDNPGFQKIQINTSKHTLKKLEPTKQEFTKLNDSKFDITNSQSSLSSLSSLSTLSTLSTSLSISSEFTNTKLNDDNNLTETFIKLEPIKQIGFVKLENGNVGTYHQKNTTQNFKLQGNNSYTDNNCNDTQTFTKCFQKIIPKIIPVSSTTSDNSSNQCIKTEAFNSGNENNKDILSKLSNNLQTIMNDSVVPIITSNCDANLFVSADNLDITKITNYDLDLLSNNSVIDKNLIMDEQLQIADQTRLVDELVSERLKNIMPDNILDTSNTANLDTELDFETLSEVFRNTRS